MNMQTAITTRPKLKTYTKAEGRAWEDHLLRHWVNAKETSAKTDTFQAYKNTGGSTVDWGAREKTVLVALNCNRPMKMPEIVGACEGMKRSSITVTLNRLLARGKVRRIGRSTETRWALPGVTPHAPGSYWDLYNQGMSKTQMAAARGVTVSSVSSWAYRQGVKFGDAT